MFCAPGTAVLGTVNFKVLAPAPGGAMVAGENAAATPAGNPVTDRATEELYVPDTAVFTVTAPLEFRATVTAAAEGVTVSLQMFSVNDVEAGAAPVAVPVTVMV
jgi:hypothetical protein